MIEEIPYGGWKNNLRIRGPQTELVITLDVGPRIIRYGLHEGANVFIEIPKQMGGAGESEWRIRGGHRFWTAPEADHSYDLDNEPVAWKKLGENSVELTQPASKKFGFQKTMQVEMLADEVVRVTHRLTATGSQPLEVTPWGLSVMAQGGTALVPQPEADLHPSEFPEGRETMPGDFLPNRELVLWPFTDLKDARYRFSEHFLRLSHRNEMPATKIGLKIPSGWIAYENQGVVFAKHIPRIASQPYPDRGVNLELFTSDAILEIESLAPLGPIALGESRQHVEHWVLREGGDLGDESSARAFFSALLTV